MAYHEDPPKPYNPDPSEYTGVNVLFFVVYLILLVVHSMFSIKSLQNEAMRNRFHITSSFTVFLLILLRMIVKAVIFLRTDQELTTTMTWKYYI